MEGAGGAARGPRSCQGCGEEQGARSAWGLDAGAPASEGVQGQQGRWAWHLLEASLEKGCLGPWEGRFRAQHTTRGHDFARAVSTSGVGQVR